MKISKSSLQYVFHQLAEIILSPPAAEESEKKSEEDEKLVVQISEELNNLKMSSDEPISEDNIPISQDSSSPLEINKNSCPPVSSNDLYIRFLYFIFLLFYIIKSS